MGKVVDITGMVFGELTVLAEGDRRPRPDGRSVYKLWRCVCSCGKTLQVETQNLKRRTPSCGCKTREKIAARNRRHGATAGRVIHGATRGRGATPEYLTWARMRRRCRNPSAKDAPYYSGVTVCERWTGKAGFTNFLADMGPRPSPQHSIDRVDGAKGYEPGNCRWATKREQSLNRRNTLMLTHNGKTQCAADWAREVGMTSKALYQRLSAGIPIARALDPTPIPYRDRVRKKP